METDSPSPPMMGLQRQSRAGASLPSTRAKAGAVASAWTASATADSGTNFVAHLSAGPGVTTAAQGQAIFHLSKDGTTLSYKLIVSNIDNVFMAHIHLTSTHGIVVWLFPSTTPDPACLSSPPSCEIQGRSDGVLAQGDITSADLTGSLAGRPLTSLMAQIEAGNTYVNVHTIQNLAGEIQGPIQ